MPLKEKEYALLGELATATKLADFQSSLNQLCAILFEPQSILAILFYPDRQPKVMFRWIPDRTLRNTFDTYYHRVGFMLDPFYQRAFLGYDIEAFQLREIAPDRFESSDYFSTYFATTQMVDEIGALQRLDETRSIHLSLGRNAGSRKYRSQDVRHFKAMAKAIMPKLAQLISLEQDGDHLTNKVSDLKKCFENLQTSDFGRLSRREAEVCALITQGHSSRAVGLKLGISTQTVKVHRRNVYKKLGISAQNELFALLICDLDTNH